MTRGILAIGVFGLAAMGMTLLTLTAGAQAPVCRHGETEKPEEAARRRSAIAFVRAVNTAQARASATTSGYQTLSDLPNLPAVPEGFRPSMAADGSAYMLAVRDMLDPCRYSLFSDQEGVIYVGRPLS